MIKRDVPTEKNEVFKEEFNSFLEKLCVAVPNYDIKRVLADFNAKVGQESYLCPACGGQSLNNKTNDNGKHVKFCTGKRFRNMVINTRTSTLPPGGPLTTKYVTR